MLAIARILRTGANLLLLDEITEGLAPVIVQKLGQVVGALRDRGFTIVLVEQNFRFASKLAENYFAENRQAARIVRLDDLYPGWEGLVAGSVYAREKILEPISAGKKASWQIWDWDESSRGASNEAGNGFREFSGGTALILEGCGALSKASAPLASLTIWIAADDATRRKRFTERDGGRFDEHWGVWAAQEEEFYEAEKSQGLAELVIQN